MSDSKGGKNSHTGHRSRLRAMAAERGLGCLQPHQIIELLLFTPISVRDTGDIAHALISRFGGLRELFEAPLSDIADTPGLGAESAAFLKAYYDIWVKFGKQRSEERSFLSSPLAAQSYFSIVFLGRGESFALTFVDEDGGICFTETVKADGSRGGLESALAEVRRLAASSPVRRCILCYNSSGRGGRSVDTAVLRSAAESVSREADIAGGYIMYGREIVSVNLR